MAETPRYEPGHVPTVCAQEECSNFFLNNKWARIRTRDWFHQKDGTSWCPDHIPDWVAQWRAKNERTLHD